MLYETIEMQLAKSTRGTWYKINNSVSTANKLQRMKKRKRSITRFALTCILIHSNQLKNNVTCISSVQLFSHVRLFVTQWTAARQASLSITNSQSLLKLMSIESVMPSNHLILCHPLLLLLSIFPIIRAFSNEPVLPIRWPKYWSFSFSISPSNEYSGLISFRIHWFDLEVQGTLKGLLQHHSSIASMLRCSALQSNFHIHTWLLEKP